MESSSHSQVIAGNDVQDTQDCSICRLPLTSKNKAFASDCLHSFCQLCIHSWVKHRATCPLCRKPVKYIYKNIRSNFDYDIEEVIPNANEIIDVGSDLETSASVREPDVTLSSSESEQEFEDLSPTVSVRESNEDISSSTSVEEINISDQESDENIGGFSPPCNIEVLPVSAHEMESDEDVLPIVSSQECDEYQSTSVSGSEWSDDMSWSSSDQELDADSYKSSSHLDSDEDTPSCLSDMESFEDVSSSDLD